MASVKLYPRIDKLNTKGKAPIYLRLTKNRKSKYIALDVYVKPEEWNEKTGKVRSNATNAFRMNNYLASKEAEAEAIALELETRSKSITAFDIKTRLVGKTPGNFFVFAEQYGKDMYKEWSIGNSRKYNCVISKLKAFHKKKKLYFDEVTVTLIKKFQRYLSGKLQNKQNTVHANLKVIRRIITEAISEELMPYEKNPFLKIKLRCEKCNRTFLLDDELMKLEELKLHRDSRMECHRDLYIFSAYSGGIRISDLLLMRWKHFDGTHLNFCIKKTKEDLRVKLPDKSLLLLQKYYKLAKKKNYHKKADPNSFIFPLIRISPGEQDRLKTHTAISAATSYTNKDLRKLTVLAGIDKKISFHRARHNWAVRALQKGMRIEYVSKILGHASVKQTEVYAKVMNEELDKAMEVFNKKQIAPIIAPTGPIQMNFYS